MPIVSRGLFRWLFRRLAVLEDFADRLNHFWTVGLLIICAAIVSYKQNYQSPISCWAPSGFSSSMILYTHSVCWDSHLIQYYEDAERVAVKLNKSMDKIRLIKSELPFVSHEVTIFRNDGDNGDSGLVKKLSTATTYYQWIPLILCLQALLFKLPNIIMYVFHGYSGLCFSKIAGLTDGFEHMTALERQLLARRVARYLYTRFNQLRSTLPCRFLTLVWLGVKILFFVNIVVQLSILDSFLRTPSVSTSSKITSYGDVLRRNFVNGGILWRTAQTLPRKVFCEFSIPFHQNVQVYTVLCHLPANALNEHVYSFIWVWFLFVAIVTSVSSLVWVIRRIIPVFRKRYITVALEQSENFDVKTASSSDVSRFCDVIGEDGVMALKLTCENSSDLLVSDVVYNLWNLKYGEQRPMSNVANSSMPQITMDRRSEQPPQDAITVPEYHSLVTVESKRNV